MSKFTMTICDIAKCRNEAVAHLPVMLVCMQENGDGAYKIYSYPNIDLCGQHDYDYRQALPDLTIERKKK